jgi:dTDP-4-amino-4,6-dideoxygalactose transaminase
MATKFLPFTRPTLDDETIEGVVEVLRSGWITTGPKVKEFEAALSAYFGGRHVRVFNSGTVTMEVALRLAGIGPGHEVITSPLTWVATANVILAVGARPVFVDVDPRTRNIDLDLVEKAINRHTRAILPVYLAGLPVDLDRLYAIAAAHGLRVIEDAAQAMGSTWRGTRIGSRGDLISFSFHANKNITTIEGGALVLAHERDIPRAEQLRFQGLQRFGEDGMEVELPGEKANLTDVAARVGLGQLPRLEEFNEKRRRLARRYFRAFDRALGCELPPADFDNTNWHMFQVVLPLDRLRVTRGEFIARMREAGIGVGVHYPPVHLFKLYRGMGWREGDFPHAERIGQGIVTLPLFPGMHEGDVDRVCAAARNVLEGAAR